MKLAPFFLLPFLLAACTEAPPPPAAPKLVRTLKVGVGDTALDGADRSYSGEVRARIETTLGFRVAGKLVERRVDVGAGRIEVGLGREILRVGRVDGAAAAGECDGEDRSADGDDET